MPANTSCNMQAMPSAMANMSAKPSLNSDADKMTNCQTVDMSSNGFTASSDCDMPNNSNCSTNNTLPFINVTKFIISHHSKTESQGYASDALPEQFPESLYRPPLIV